MNTIKQKGDGEMFGLEIYQILNLFAISNEEKERKNLKFEKMIRKLFKEYHMQWNELCEQIGPKVHIPKLTKNIEKDDINECLTEMDTAEKQLDEIIKKISEQMKYMVLIKKYDYKNMKLKPNNIFTILEYVTCGIMICESVALSILAYMYIKKNFGDIACMNSLIDYEMECNFLKNMTNHAERDIKKIEQNAKEYKKVQCKICEKYIKGIDDEIEEIIDGEKKIGTMLEDEKDNIAKKVIMKWKMFDEVSIKRNSEVIRELENENEQFRSWGRYYRQIDKVKQKLDAMENLIIDELKDREVIKIRKDCADIGIEKINIVKVDEGENSFWLCKGEDEIDELKESDWVLCEYFKKDKEIVLDGNMHKITQNTSQIEKISEFINKTEREIVEGIREEIAKIKFQYIRRRKFNSSTEEISNISEGYNAYIKESFRFKKGTNNVIREEVAGFKEEGILIVSRTAIGTALITAVFVVVIDMLIYFFETLCDYFIANKKFNQMMQLADTLERMMEKSIYELAKFNQELKDGVIKMDEKHILILQKNKKAPIVVKIEDCIE
ncbi:MAG: hypothetical protein ACRCSG_02355 [Cellulosilyticaceae bacterium]